MDRTRVARAVAALALLDAPEQFWVFNAGGFVVRDVRGDGRENLEQHAHRNEPGAEPAAAAESAHGRAHEPDQSSFSFQHAQYRFVADPLRSRYGSRCGDQT